VVVTGLSAPGRQGVVVDGIEVVDLDRHACTRALMSSFVTLSCTSR
jgi:hypothetical protein